MIRTIEQTTMRKVYLRVLPIAAVSYFFCYLDRINVGFAALTMNKDLGLDAATSQQWGVGVDIDLMGLSVNAEISHLQTSMHRRLEEAMIAAAVTPRSCRAPLSLKNSLV